MNRIKWISVAERLPEKTCMVLVYCPYTDVPELEGRGFTGRVQFSAKHQRFNASDLIDDAESAFDGVTHWAEDIEPPEGYRP